jgi:DNA-binding NarL/FixJ family response regulator
MRGWPTLSALGNPIGKEASDHKIPIDMSAWHSELGRVALLSTREVDVFRLLGAGLSNHDIAIKLAVTERTVKAHITQVMKKLQVTSRLQVGLVSFAHQLMHQGPIHLDAEIR